MSKVAADPDLEVALAALRRLGFESEARSIRSRRDLEAAARRAGNHSWPLALLGAASAAAGDLPAAKAAFQEAIARRPAARLYAELAKVNEKLGILPEALENAASAIRLEACPEHHELKAQLHVCWREYELAAEEYGRALALAAKPALFFMRSRALASAGRLQAALADAEAALERAPEEENLAAWRHQLLLFRGRRAQARRVLGAALKVGAPLAVFGSGYSLLCEARFDAAALEFGRCARAAGEGALARKAGFYRTVAEVLADGEAGPRRRPEVFLIGLGVNPPYSATAEALRAVRSCNLVFNNVAGEEIFELLRPLCREVRPLAYHQMNDEGVLCDLMMAEVRPGRRVGFVTRGNAVVYGPLGAELLRRCRARSLRWRCVDAVCSFDLFSARCGWEGLPSGAWVADSKAIGPRTVLDTGSPATIYLDLWNGDEVYRRMSAALAKSYGRGRTCLAFDHVVDQNPMRRPMAALTALRPSLSWSAILHIPVGGS